MALPPSKRKSATTSADSRTASSQLSQRNSQQQNGAVQESSLSKLRSLKKDSSSARPISSNTLKALSPQSKKQQSTASPKRSRIAASKAPVGKGSIQSFFNNATQKSVAVGEPGISSQSSLPAAAEEDIETIDSDEDQSGIIPLSKGSSTALAVRKRKAQHIENRGDFSENVRSASQKFRKTDAGPVPSPSIHQEDKRSWIDRFAPVNLDELAVHKRKVTDVRGWLELAFNSRRNKALVLKGAAGTGKTTTLRLLAQDLGINVHEWSNPAGKDYVDNAVSSALQFEEFVSRAGRSGGLQFDTDETLIPERHVQAKLSGSVEKQVLLIEDFPNTFAKNSAALQAFRSTIAQHLASPVLQSERPIPLILIISETLLSTNTAVADSFTTHRLLGPELTMHPHIDTIEFNAIAPTILLKALETIVIKEARKSGRRTTPNAAILRQIAEFGDIRSAVSALEFLCLRGDADACWSAKIAFTKPKKKIADNALSKEETEALKWISNRESTLGIFHSVGKVVYNKRVDSAGTQCEANLPPWLTHCKRPKLPENEPNELMNDIGTDTDTFISALHENYVLSCTGFNNEAAMEVAEACIGNLSDGDLLSLDQFSASNRAYAGSASDSLRQEELAFQVVIRGLQYDLPANVKRITPANAKPGDTFRMFYPSSLKLWRRREEIQDTLDTVIARLQSEHASKDVDGESTTALTQSKTELLLQSLPYMSKIEQRRSRRSGLIDLMRSVVDIPLHAVPMAAGIDEADMANAQDDNNEISDWATDRPVEAAGPFARPKKSSAQQKNLLGKESKAQVLELQKMDSLILEDDDIVDE